MIDTRVANNHFEETATQLHSSTSEMLDQTGGACSDNSASNDAIAVRFKLNEYSAVILRVTSMALFFISGLVFTGVLYKTLRLAGTPKEIAGSIAGGTVPISWSLITLADRFVAAKIAEHTKA